MEIKKLQETIYQAICEIQDLSGRPISNNSVDTMIPLKDMDGFDSLNAIEVTAQLCQKLNCTLSGNPFVSGNNPLTIGQIAQQLLNKMEKPK